MKFPVRSLCVAAAACAFLSAPAAVQAATICVSPATGCDSVGSPHTTFESAITEASGLAGRDTIKLGEATYTATSQFAVNSEVELVGAGRDKTFLAPTGTVSYVLWMQTTGSTVEDLTINKSDTTSYGLRLSSSSADNVKVVGNDGSGANQWGVYFSGISGNLTNSTVVFPVTGGNDWAVRTSGGTHTFDNVELTGDNAVVQHSGTVTVNRSKLTGHRTYVINGSGTANINTSLIRAQVGSTTLPIALQSVSSYGNVANLTVNQSTIVGSGGSDSRGISVDYFADACPQTGYANADVNSTTVSGFTFPSWQSQFNCVGTSSPTTCPAPAGGTTRMQWTNSHRDNFNVFHGSGCRGFSNVQFGTPGFVSDSDFRPRQPSPLIDKGDPASDAGGEKDLNGNPRVVDGDADGSARRDIGAYEYQRQGPSVTASVSPGSGPVSTSFAFSAAGSDPDGEALQYIWTFSDGQASGGAAVSKTFGSLGSHSGTVQAIDAAGLSASSTAGVTVANTTVVATPTPVPTVTPPKDTTAPAVTVKGGRLKANKRGNVKVTITCPASESAPCKIAIAAKSAKKIVLRRGRKKIQSLGSGSGSVPAGKSASVTFKLTKNALRYLKRKKKIPATLAVTATDAAGNSAKASAKATIVK